VGALALTVGLSPVNEPVPPAALAPASTSTASVSPSEVDSGLEVDGRRLVVVVTPDGAGSSAALVLRAEDGADQEVGSLAVPAGGEAPGFLQTAVDGSTGTWVQLVVLPADASDPVLVATPQAADVVGGRNTPVLQAYPDGRHTVYVSATVNSDTAPWAELRYTAADGTRVTLPARSDGSALPPQSTTATVSAGFGS
jgi:hypothetical protein